MTRGAGADGRRRVLGAEAPRALRPATGRPYCLGLTVVLLVLCVAWARSAPAQTIKVGSFPKASGAGQVVAHGLGATPKALILWTDGKTNETFSTDYLYAFGMTDGTTSKSAAMASRSSGAGPTSARRIANKVITIIDYNSAVQAEADLQSWDATNFTLFYTTNANSTPYVIHFIAIGGSSVSAKVVNWTMPNATGNRQVTGVGFTPDVVLHAHAGDGFTAAPPSNSSGAHFALGVMDRNGGQWTNDFESVSGPPAVTLHGQQTNACIYGFNSLGAVQKKASFVSMDPDGFTVNFTTVANANLSQVISLALKGVRAKAGAFLKSTSASSPSYVQSKSGSVGGVASYPMTFNAASTSGDLIVVSFNFDNQGRSVTSVTDNLGNVYRKAIGPVDWAAGERAYTYYAPSITGGAVITLTITLSGPATSFIEAYAGEYRGVAAADPLDQTSFATGTGTAMNSGSKTTLSPVELIWGFCDAENGSTSATGPINVRELYNWNFAGDWTVTSTGTYSVTGTLSLAYAWTCHMATFRGGQSVSGVGFPPSAVLLSSVQDVTQANPVAGGRLGVGAADNASGQGASALTDQDAANPTVAGAIDKTSKAFVKANNDTGTVNAEAVVASFDPDGFSLTWTTNDAVATQITYLALGPTPPTTNYRSIGTAANITNDGTITVTAGSAVVTRVGGVTGWKTANRGRGDRLTVAGTDHYMVRSVDSDNQLTLASPAVASYTGSIYTIARQFTTLGSWESCIDGPPGCPYFPVASASLVADDRREVGIAYNDSIFTLTSNLIFDGSTTDAAHSITLTVDPGNRHNGTPGAGVRVYENLAPREIEIHDDNVTIEWLELYGFRGGDYLAQVRVIGPSAQNVLLQNLLMHDFYDPTANVRQNAIRLSDVAGKSVTVRNTMIWDGDDMGIVGDEASDTLTIENCSVNWMHDTGAYGISGQLSTVTVRNTISTNNTGADFNQGGGTLTGTNNTSSDASAATYFSDAQTGVAGSSVFVSSGVAAANLHLKSGANVAVDSGLNLSSSFSFDIDGQLRPAGAAWDRGADEFGAATAVELMSFSATGADGAVDLSWRTGSELDNLGFHLYRGLAAEGPWTRITSSLIPGLGSSPLGATYSWRDSGLQNGVRYYYRLEDVDTASRSTFHGPVSAVPAAASSPPGEGGGDEGGGDDSERGGGETLSASCPRWVLAAAPEVLSPTCTKHGNPDSVSLQVLSRDASGATLELHTGGFWTLEDASGTVRVFVQGLEFPADAKAPALPLRRALVDAAIGKQVHLVSAEALELQSLPGLRPSAVGRAEMAGGRDGTVRPSRRSLPARFLSRGYVPAEVARLAGTVFQGERKSAVVEITPVRYSGRGLVLAGRVRVKLAFAGVAQGEIPTGGGGRTLPRKGAFTRGVLARLFTSRRGLYAVRYEALFPQEGRGFSTALLRLQRQGEAVRFHVEPSGRVFGRGSVLYFYADREISSTEYSGEVAYELVRGLGTGMGVSVASPAGPAVVLSSTGYASFETNRIYQPGLLEASDIWLWEAMVSGSARTEGFTLSGVDVASGDMARLVVYLQGGSESGTAVDHHVRVSVNGVEVGEATFAGKRPHQLDALVPASVLREGANELAVANVGDTRVYSLVFLDRFEVSYPQISEARGGVFEGAWAEGGTAEVSGLSGPAVILRDPRRPCPEGSTVKWMTGFEVSGSSVRFRAEAGHRYLVVSPEGVLTPRVGRAALSTLRDGSNQADYIVIAPRQFLEAAAPLLERRRSQGLRSRTVAFEAIASEFGHGQPSAEAIRAFLSYAYHSWQRPSPRYVLLLGDATDDPQRFLSSSWASPLPALLTRTSYLWTASDPALAAVNGEDALPDLAIGRLPATTVEQAEALVSKLLAWEDSGEGLSGSAVLVADTPDAGGDFEADVDDVRSSFLAERPATTLKVRELGSETRSAILDAFDEGASLMSYVGHGGTAVWSSSNVLSTWDVPSLRAQSRQPVLLTLNCLNGYFVAPNFDALPEALLKAEGRGVVAAFSPSGLSLDGPAHEYHRALVAELASGRHERLGDAILAAQRTYAQAGLMPELLTIYHLLGDPATKVR